MALVNCIRGTFGLGSVYREMKMNEGFTILSYFRNPCSGTKRDPEKSWGRSAITGAWPFPSALWTH